MHLDSEELAEADGPATLYETVTAALSVQSVHSTHNHQLSKKAECFMYWA